MHVFVVGHAAGAVHAQLAHGHQTRNSSAHRRDSEYSVAGDWGGSCEFYCQTQSKGPQGMG